MFKERPSVSNVRLRLCCARYSSTLFKSDRYSRNRVRLQQGVPYGWTVSQRYRFQHSLHLYTWPTISFPATFLEIRLYIVRPWLSLRILSSWFNVSKSRLIVSAFHSTETTFCGWMLNLWFASSNGTLLEILLSFTMSRISQIVFSCPKVITCI